MVTKMPRQDRAKQFIPFAALKGYPEALRQKEKNAIPPIQLLEDRQTNLDKVLHEITKNDLIAITYYNQGEYFTTTGRVSQLDKIYRTLKVADITISLDHIYDITIM